MVWIALSIFIMSLTGTGDDTFVFRKFIERVRDGIAEEVHDGARRQKALKALDKLDSAFAKHRRRVGKISACVERADRTYAAKAADYERCRADAKAAWDAAAADLIVIEGELRSSLTPAEVEAVRRRALK